MHERELTDTGTGGPPAAPAPEVTRAPSAHAAIWWRLVLGVLVAVLGTLLLVKVVGGSSGPRTTTDLTLTSPSCCAEVTGIPASVFDHVGVRSPAVPIVPPVVTHADDTLTARGAAGARVPVVLFIGTEYNPFSAAERWPLIAALSRFGTFTTLHDVDSSPTDFAPDTPTFSFYDVAYHSDYVDAPRLRGRLRRPRPERLRTTDARAAGGPHRGATARPDRDVPVRRRRQQGRGAPGRPQPR